MLRTIQIGAYLLIQGLFIREEPGGKIVIKVGKRTYTGFPVM